MIKRGISILLICLTLVGTVGIPMTKHTCHLFGITTYSIGSLGNVSSCSDATNNSEESFTKSSCCSISSEYLVLESFDHSTSSGLYQSISINDVDQVKWVSPTNIILKAQNKTDYRSFFYLSPPLKHRLAILQQYLI